MAARLLIIAGVLLLPSWPVYADIAPEGLTASIPEVTRDAIRDRVIENYRQAPHATRYEPDAARMRHRMRLPNRTDNAHVSGGPDRADVELFFASGTPLGTVIDTLARSLGYDKDFQDPGDRRLRVPHPIRGHHDVAEVAGWLTERTGVPIIIFPESRLISVYHGDFTR